MTQLEPFTWDRIPAALAIEQQLFALQPWSEAQFWSELAGVPASRYYVAATDGAALVGYAGLYLNDAEAEIQTVAVAPAAQRRGIGRLLVEDLLAEARRRGAHRVLLEARAENARAIALYETFGFALIARRPNYYALGVDAVVMERHV